MEIDPNSSALFRVGPSRSLDDLLWEVESQAQPDAVFLLACGSLNEGAPLGLFPVQQSPFSKEPPLREYLLQEGKAYRIAYDAQATTLAKGYIELEPQLGGLPYVYASSVAATTPANLYTARLAVTFVADARLAPLALALHYKGTPLQKLSGSLRVWPLELPPDDDEL